MLCTIQKNKVELDAMTGSLRYGFLEKARVMPITYYILFKKGGSGESICFFVDRGTWEPHEKLLTMTATGRKTWAAGMGDRAGGVGSSGLW